MSNDNFIFYRQQKEIYKQKLYEVKKENMKIIRKTENVTEEIKELEEALKSGLELASNIIYVKIFFRKWNGWRIWSLWYATTK